MKLNVIGLKPYYHRSQIWFETFAKSKLRIEEMQIRFPFAKSSAAAAEIASSQVLSAKPTGCRQEGGSQSEENWVKKTQRNYLV